MHKNFSIFLPISIDTLIKSADSLKQQYNFELLCNACYVITVYITIYKLMSPTCNYGMDASYVVPACLTENRYFCPHWFYKAQILSTAWTQFVEILICTFQRERLLNSVVVYTIIMLLKQQLINLAYCLSVIRKWENTCLQKFELLCKKFA